MVGGHDQRDAQTWVVIELTRLGETRVEEGTLATLLRDSLGVAKDYPVFIPSVTYVSNGTPTTLHLMEGYAFVGTGLPEVQYFGLEGVCPYVRKVLASKSMSGLRVLNVISDKNIQDMRDKLSQFVSSELMEGMHVKVTGGTYANLDGDVVALRDNDASVRIVLRSIDLVAKIPRVFLTPSERE